MRTQEEVNVYVEKTKAMVEEVEDEKSAVEVLKRIMRLHNCSEQFFVPIEVNEWEEFALAFINSPQGVFSNIMYPERIKAHTEIQEKINEKEKEALAEEQEKFFYHIEMLNREVRQFNHYCREYNEKILPRFTIKNPELLKEYKKWQTSLPKGEINYIYKSTRRIRVLEELYENMGSVEDLANILHYNKKDLYDIMTGLAEKDFVTYDLYDNTKIYKIGVKGARYLYTVGDLL